MVFTDSGFLFFNSVLNLKRSASILAARSGGEVPRISGTAPETALTEWSPGLSAPRVSARDAVPQLTEVPDKTS